LKENEVFPSFKVEYVDAGLFSVNSQEWKDCMEKMKQSVSVEHVWESPSISTKEHSSISWKDVEWYACGMNDHGQLGLGHNQEKVLSMTRVCFPVPFVSISIGFQHTLALDEKGGVWSWGSNYYGQLGLGHNNDCNAPQKVTYFECTENTTARLIAAAYHHSSVLTSMM
jgi:alpha-tubulin suppressor-like RCC1 family protein